MGFIKKINHKKFTLLGIFLFLYVILNLLDGERGLISFHKKQKMKKQLILEKEILVKELSSVEKKNRLLTEPVDIDYLETLYRKKFLVGRSEEKVYVNK